MFTQIDLSVSSLLSSPAELCGMSVAPGVRLQLAVAVVVSSSAVGAQSGSLCCVPDCVSATSSAELCLFGFVFCILVVLCSPGLLK